MVLGFLKAIREIHDVSLFGSDFMDGHGINSESYEVRRSFSEKTFVDPFSVEMNQEIIVGDY